MGNNFGNSYAARNRIYFNLYAPKSSQETTENEQNPSQNNQSLCFWDDEKDNYVSER